MRKILLLVLAFSILSIAPVRAAVTITISEPTHRLSPGIFLDDTLAQEIAPTGRLGKLLFDRKKIETKWLVDVAVIEEIADLADGYTYLDSEQKEVSVSTLILADIWLNTFRTVTRNAVVLALPYGNPSSSLVKKIEPSELDLYSALGQERLSLYLDRKVGAVVISDPGKISDTNISLYRELRSSISIINTVVTLREVEDLRLRLAQLLHPGLDEIRGASLRKALGDAVVEMNKRIRVSGGNYTITSSSYELPITVVNRFDQQINLDLRISASNSRVLVGKSGRISVAAQSQLQIKVPLTVIASGDTVLRVQLWTPAGAEIGSTKKIPLRLAVISTATTWFATFLTVILLFAIVVQSLRRVKRRRSR